MHLLTGNDQSICEVDREAHLPAGDNMCEEILLNYGNFNGIVSHEFISVYLAAPS
jgi:hypothetical protein